MKVTVEDPFGAAADPRMPSLAQALDPVRAGAELKRGLPRLSGTGELRLKSIRVTRHKPGRRCVVEYDVRIIRPDGSREKAILVGKVRARRYGKEGFRLLEDFWNRGFDEHSTDGIAVPEPLGVLPALQMWFQRKVPGKLATLLFHENQAVELARRVAEAAHKLHRAGVPTGREHRMADELRILDECFDRFQAVRPEWTRRIKRLAEACTLLGASLPEPVTCGIHRDFYASQVIVARKRLYLLDFDLYCLGDPALDIGNFIGHLTEQSLRQTGSPDALAQAERALEERFVELAGQTCRSAIQAYTTLTLARLLYLSTQLPGRESTTRSLFALCERRLRIAPNAALQSFAIPTPGPGTMRRKPTGRVPV